MKPTPADLAPVIADIQRVLRLIGAGQRPAPADVRIVRVAERRGHIARDHLSKRFVLTSTGRQLAAHPR